ncbi:MAG: isocitrate/isopropylmalate dehydrogenase family protein [Clostridiales bacterium]|jgi:isocitrate dehydrogenase (NAD+)|nr:isocitrate/isopropylmalate dehydrogenase family protein [Clostridiales bacterium]
MDKIEAAKEKFESLMEEQLKRIERLKSEADFLDFKSLEQIVIGVVGGDGIGPAITAQAAGIIADLLKDDISSGKVSVKNIEGLTIERRAAEGKAIPDDVLEELKECHVILKGPTTTPQAGSPWPNVESANVAMRKELDLFANVRPVRVPELGIDWTFYRENTEGAYAVGSKGFDVDEDLALDFTVATTQGTRRIIKAAFEFAKASGKTRVTAVTKANVIKTTDGKFLRIAREIAKGYPGITLDEWYIDIMTAKLIDAKRRTQFQVLVLPNLYGDILTDEAAEFQGGVGTAGSANIGKRYAMFEAIHGSAPRMVEEGRAKYADPSSIIRAAAMLLNHIGYAEESDKLTKALDICAKEKAVAMTGREDGASSDEFSKYLLKTIARL